MSTLLINSGVYGIVNTVNKKVYIGSTAGTFKKRFNCHKRQLRLGRHGNRHLQAAWDKYGEESFEFCVVEECEPGFCTVLETWWIDYYEATNRDKGYNKREVADSNLGIKRSDETRLKQSERAKNRSESVRANMSAAQLGKKHSPETKAKMSATRKGRVTSLETKNRISESRMRSGSDASAKLIEYQGRVQSITSWAREFGLSKHLVYTRLNRGWSVEKTLQTPVHKHR